jgi:UDP-N-acetylmuramoylalanine--D-glutamate ligase
MLRAAGLRTIDAGNTETPLVDALALDLDAFVVESASFRLAWTPTFRAEGAAWLNLAPDHLNWHRSMESYEAAKAQIYANQRPDDVAVGFVDDPTVMRRLSAARGRQVTFGLRGADYREGGGRLVGPNGEFASVAAMRRSLPHDITNALAAAALVLETGMAGPDVVAQALATFSGPPHRLEYVGTWNEVAWYNDSKATTPHAAAAAIRSFDGIVLIAGGYDKHVDLTPMAVDADHVAVVIALGATAPAIVDAFGSVDRREVVDDLAEAVALASRIAPAGSTVLLSPGCASFDQFTSFEHRGDRFRALALAAHEGES